jgi:cysteinyl-tRNA synthetase
VLGLGLNKRKEDKKVIPDNILELANERQKARENKDWQKADELRKEIESLGYTIKDQDNNNFEIIKE